MPGDSQMPGKPLAAESRPRLLLLTAISIALASGALAWWTGLANQAFDYDEVMHAHTIWQIASGLVPFHDFYECHPPFLWYAFLPFFGLLPEAPEALFGLRLFSGLGTLAGLGAIYLLIRIDRPQIAGVWIVLGLASVLFSTGVLDYALQFRVDTWGNALLFAAIARFEWRSSRAGWGGPDGAGAASSSGVARCLPFAELGLLASLAILATPKLYCLPIAFCAVDLARRARAGRSLTPALVGYGVGISAACGLALLALLFAGIDPVALFDLSIRFHLLFGERAHFEDGLLEMVLSQWSLLSLVALGGMAWAYWLVRTRSSASSFELAVLLTCLQQLAMVPYPHVQYVAPWFMLAAIFVPFIGLVLEVWAKEGPARFALPVAASLAVALVAVASQIHYSRTDGAARFLSVQNTIVKLAPPGSPILVPPPFHPVVRHDAIYGLIDSWSPNGVTTEALLREMDLSPFQEKRGAERYLEELEANRPTVILFTGQREFFYSPEQEKAVRDYLSRHAADYRKLLGMNPSLYVRADSVETAASSSGLGAR